MGNSHHKSEYVYRNEAGDLEIVDLVTGELIVNSNKPPEVIYSFDYRIALLVCQETAKGKTLAAIAAMPGMPPLEVISHWQRSDRMFAEELKLARRERGEVYHDRVIELANDAAVSHKDAIPGISAAINAFKWAAERNAPDRYGNKVVHEGSEEKPIVMRVINTGISREVKPQIIEVINKGKEHVEQSKAVRSEDEEDQGEDS